LFEKNVNSSKGKGKVTATKISRNLCSGAISTELKIYEKVTAPKLATWS
jgi:hypothetical protein